MNATDNPTPPREIKRIPGINAGDNDIVLLVDTGDPWDFHPLTDAQESMLGPARHKTLGGRGIVGQLTGRNNKSARKRKKRR